jgi:hypothetical protein
MFPPYRPTHITLVVSYDDEGGEQVVGTYYDETKAKTVAEQLDRPIWEAEVAGLKREFARARTMVAEHPLSKDEVVYFDTIAQTRGGTHSARMAARDKLVGMRKPEFWHDSDPRDWLAFFEKQSIDIADFAAWRAKSGRHRAYTIEITDAPKGSRPR